MVAGITVFVYGQQLKFHGLNRSKIYRMCGTIACLLLSLAAQKCGHYYILPLSYCVPSSGHSAMVSSVAGALIG